MGIISWFINQLINLITGGPHPVGEWVSHHEPLVFFWPCLDGYEWLAMGKDPAPSRKLYRVCGGCVSMDDCDPDYFLDLMINKHLQWNHLRRCKDVCIHVWSVWSIITHTYTYAMLGIFRYILNQPAGNHQPAIAILWQLCKPWARQSCNHVTTEISRSKYRRRHSSGRHTPGKTCVGESSNIRKCIYIYI